MSYELMHSLGIKLVKKEKDEVVMTMPVDERTHQPYGYLHGGASVLLAETAASIGGALHVDLEKQAVFGMEINANHIKSKRSGTVTASAKPLHIGRSTMVWEINITDEKNEIICVSRCTLGVVSKSK
ncbi:MAG TPA: hotdog fold thioesterase [Pseudogracilibacillus sp.]|nr:hotdog fold thioesterase [Pseudogracilibacillus sp.]